VRCKKQLTFAGRCYMYHYIAIEVWCLGIIRGRCGAPLPVLHVSLHIDRGLALGRGSGALGESG
jgi:hypothetical protein